MPIEVKLTAAQARLLAERIQAAVMLGECEMHGYTLRFANEGVATEFEKKVWSMPTPTTRAYVSMMAVIGKLDAAVRPRTAEELYDAGAALVRGEAK